MSLLREAGYNLPVAFVQFLNVLGRCQEDVSDISLVTAVGVVIPG